MPYVALQQMLDEANAWGFHCYDKGFYLDDFTDDVDPGAHRAGAAQAVAGVGRAVLPPRRRLLEVAEDATAFSGSRAPGFAGFIIAVCPTPELLEPTGPGSAVVLGRARAGQPSASAATSTRSAMPAWTTGSGRRTATKYDRLAAIKATYDPDNIFHRNANIKPA